MNPTVSKILQSFVHHGDTVIVGVSGGPDSTALLHFLLEFSKKTPCRIVVVHMNHGIRGAEADADEKFVRALAGRYGLPFEVTRVKLAGKSGLEEKGRIARRAFFEKLYKQYGARWIMTAHTEDDQIETIIFNFLRGSGPRGLSGMKVVDGYYLKPLLSLSKSEILTYLKKRKLKFRSDSTNKDTKLRRNFIRKKILPLLYHINPSFRTTILRNSAIFADVSDWLTSQAQRFLKKYRKGDRLFSLDAYEALPEALKRVVIQEAYRFSFHSSYGLPMVRVNEVLRLLNRRVGRKKILFGQRGGLLLKQNALYILH